MALTRESILGFLDDELGVDVSEISDHTELVSTGIVDSLAVMDLVTFVERSGGFKVRTTDITLGNFNTIPAILQFAATKRG
jgi:acyl carrier protein